MLKKLEIKNVGRLKNLKTNGDNQYFKQNTFIFGKNTFGKSTLTAIFRSLKENNPDFIVGRKTIGGGNQIVKITPMESGEYSYLTENNKWFGIDQGLKEIVIFDNHFVRGSVYTQNQQIGQDQQKNIEAFMLGPQGVEYNKNINELTEKISENTKTQRTINLEYARAKHLLGNIDFEKFLLAGKIEDVDKEIDKEKKELDKIKNSEFITNKLKNLKLLLNKYKGFDCSTISIKLRVDSDLLTKHFQNHIKKGENKQTYSEFLQIGAKLRTRSEKELCPFCTQKIDGENVKSFLETIDAIYDRNYKNLRESIRVAEDVFSKEKFVIETDKIKSDLTQSGYSLQTNYSDVNNLLEECAKAIANKKEDLSLDFNQIPFDTISVRVINLISNVDSELKQFENPADSKIKSEQRLNNLLASKERHSSWKERAINYSNASVENKKLTKQKSDLWEKYLIYAKGLSGKILEDINTFLKECHCNFSVQQFEFKGNQRKDLLVICLEGLPILNEGEDDEPTIKNSLSDSDKSILALAFFLVTIKNDSSAKIVVMDDPVSSFDSDRKKLILKEIRKVFLNSDKQLILLTHEKGFYRLLYAENKNDTQSTFLKLSVVSELGSDLVECNPEEDPELINEFNLWICGMRDALGSHDIHIVKQAHIYIRLVIEHIIKSKYPLELKKEDKTIEAMLVRLEDSGGPYEIGSPRSSILEVLHNISHHDNSGVAQYPVEELGIEDYKSDINKTFVVMKAL